MDLANKRLNTLDTLRGILLINMILYHTFWDLVYIYNIQVGWFTAIYGKIWQQAICCGFIFLSGFCRKLCKSNLSMLKHSIILICCGTVITAVTHIFAPDSIIIFGILSFLGVAAAVLIPFNMVLKNTRYWLTGFAASLLIFIIIKNINYGYIGFGECKVLLSRSLYSGLFMTSLGFTDPTFRSTDYFAFLPWFFLYISGYFLGIGILGKYRKYLTKGVEPLNFLGRHSLLCYMLHQPVVYGVSLLIFRVLCK